MKGDRARFQVASRARSMHEEVHEIRMEISRLQGNIDVLLRNPLSRVRCPIDRLRGLRVASAYFSMCRFGIDPDRIGDLVSTDVVFHGEFGFQEYLEQWQRYCSYFDSFAMYGSCMETIAIDEGLLCHCVGFLNLKISRKTIECVFPHLLHDQTMMLHLIGCTLQVPLVLRMVVGLNNDHILALDSDLGFTSALAVALNNPSTAADVMTNARIDGNFFLAGADK